MEVPDNIPPIFLFFQLVRAVSHHLTEGIPTPGCWLAGRCQNKDPGVKRLAGFEQGAGVVGTVGVALSLLGK